VRHVLLHGSGDERIEFRYFDARGGSAKRSHPWEGILPNLERRYRETESATVREELARYRGTRACADCGGSRLNLAARNVFVGGRTLPQLTALPIAEALRFFTSLEVEGWRGEIARRLVREITDRITFLVDVGLDYLSLDRSAETLSGGEAQRIRLASQIGSGLVGVMYILDEPSIGLHQRDNQRLLDTLTRLRDLGNTVLVVEHDEDAIRQADYVVDLGPGAGIHGGRVVAQGTPAEVEAAPDSLTGQYLSGRRRIPVPPVRTPAQRGRSLRIVGATGNNLRDVTAEVPLGLLTCVTGVSGSGKSTLVVDTLYRHVAAALQESAGDAAPCRAVEGLEQIDRVIDIDQSPIGRTPRSNPATYTGLFGPIRELFAEVPEARARGYDPGRFSFNVRGGRCESCEGDGVIKVEMHFLPDAYVTCDACRGMRYNRETLEIRYKGRSIHEVLEMTVEDAATFFRNVPALQSKLTTLLDVGLSYVRLGQNATTLSGGEAQRVKLARELAKRSTGRTLYILDEPTTGLHFHDIEQLLAVLQRLRDEGNTIVVIEHNLDVIKTADWVIDLGPEGGDGGGRIVAAGTPEDLAKEPASHTGRYLARTLGLAQPPPAARTSRRSA
jgi:excinuclease ABC subunit A